MLTVLVAMVAIIKYLHLTDLKAEIILKFQSPDIQDQGVGRIALPRAEGLFQASPRFCGLLESLYSSVVEASPPFAFIFTCVMLFLCACFHFS